jgi:NADH-quinone oxidoreductase subunit G
VMDIAEGSLLAVPVTSLYDRGNTVLPSRMLLKGRIPEPHVMLNPADAERLGFSGDTSVGLSVDGTQFQTRVRINEDVPQGVVLVPRSLGIPVVAPVAVELTAVGAVEVSD